MSYNFSNIDLNQSQFITISSINYEGAYNRRCYGIEWVSGDYKSYLTFRITQVLKESELQIVGSYHVLLMIKQFLRDYTEFQKDIFISIGEEACDVFYGRDKTICGTTENYINRVNIQLNYLSRMSFDIDFDAGIVSPELQRKTELALKDHQLINDFQTETRYLSSVSSKRFDEMLFYILGPKLIQYIGQMETGIRGPEKRLITPSDEVSVNAVGDSIGTSGFPPRDSKILSKVRRMMMTVRDSDLTIIATPTTGESFIFPDSFIPLAAKYYNVPIYILDSNDLIWYTKSKSERRDIVKAKKMPILDNYKNISIYANSINLEQTWKILKKLFSN